MFSFLVRMVGIPRRVGMRIIKEFGKAFALVYTYTGPTYTDECFLNFVCVLLLYLFVFDTRTLLIRSTINHKCNWKEALFLIPSVSKSALTPFQRDSWLELLFIYLAFLKKNLPSVSFLDISP